MPIELTVAEVAAIINVAIILGYLPSAFCGGWRWNTQEQDQCGDMASSSMQATTDLIDHARHRSVFGRLINGTNWPLLLGTDSASSKKVDKRIQSLTWTAAIVTVILGLAAIATPLGLSSTIQLSKAQETLFSYVKDQSPIGKATLARDQYVMRRWCTGGACPGNVKAYEWDLAHLNTSQLGNPWASAGTASNVTNVLTSATVNTTIASVFDIQYRSYYQVPANETPLFGGFSNYADKSFTQGQFVYFQQFLLNDKIEVAEGVIVSTTDSPGIGFRNHTLPPESKLGFGWDEDILWLEPETHCTNLNISFDYTVPTETLSSWLDTRITDRGGLVRVPEIFPSISLGDAQSNPGLLERSWVAATSTNKLLANMWGVNSSYYGKSYYLNRRNSTNFPIYGAYPNAIATSQLGEVSRNLNFSTWTLNLPMPLGSIGLDATTPVEKTLNLVDLIVPYNENMTQDISKIGFGTGMLFGAGRQVDDSGAFTDQISSIPLKPGLRYSHPLYSCVSAVKASVKTISFKIDQEPILSNLKIVGVRTSNMTGRHWAVEKSGRRLRDGNPLWGLLSTSKKDDPDVSITDQKSLYLPAGFSWLYAIYGQDLASTMTDSMAGSTLPLTLMAALYDPEGTMLKGKFPDYSGATNWAMYTKWAGLSRNESTTPQIINLIWTDLMVNAVMGSNSRLRQRSDATLEILASRYAQTVSYDWRYASVALVFALVYLLLLLLSLFLYVIRAWNLGSLRFFLDQSSAGRTVTTERFGISSAVDLAKTSVWASGRGFEMVRVGKETVGSREPSLKGYQIVKTKDSSVL